MPSQRSGSTSNGNGPEGPDRPGSERPAAPGAARPSPLLSGLDTDDEEDDGERPQPKALRRGVGPAVSGAQRVVSAPVGVVGSSAQPALGSAKLPPVGSAKLPAVGSARLPAVTSAQLGALDVPVRSERGVRKEPTIAVEDDMLVLDDDEVEAHSPTLASGVPAPVVASAGPVAAAQPVASAPSPVLPSPVLPSPVLPSPVLPSRPVQALPSSPVQALAMAASGPLRAPSAGGEATLMIPSSGAAQVLTTSRPHQIIASSRPNAVLSLGEETNETTRIVNALNLAELNQPRARKSQAAAVLDGLGDEAPPVVAPATGDLKKGPQRRKPIQDVKASSKAKVTPIDPTRLAVQQEAAEARKVESTLPGVSPGGPSAAPLFERLGGDLGQDGGGESTMIGRFLGLVGVGGGGSAPRAVDPVAESWDTVQSAPFLDGLNPQFLQDALRAGDLQVLRPGRDLLLDTDGRALLVLEGQIALGRFRPDVLERERRAQRGHKPGDKRTEKREQKRRQEAGPLIRLAETNLALFTEGDLLGLEGQHVTPGDAVYTVTPAVILSVTRARLEAWRRTYQFFGDRMRRAADAARSRIAANSGARALVADFFVRQGLSVAMSLRVREIDKCIECYECEKACAERYGVKRLSLNGKVLGTLDFVDCCHTCVDQRCIDPCAFDAIKFDPVKREVLIVEEACTGCTLCAVACPYDAIEMHELDDKPRLTLRLEKQGKLGFGDGQARKAKLRRIASKCDHCVSYEDQACISACPTGALLEIPPEAAFTERTESLADAAKGGFDKTVMVDAQQIFNPQKFMSGLERTDDKGRVAERHMSTGGLWILGGLFLLVCVIEIALRLYDPRHSGSFLYQTRAEGLDELVALQNIDYRPGSPLAVWLGWIGTVVMFSSTFYSLRKWVPGFKRLGAQRGWFDYHVWSGTIGPALVLLHSAAKLDNWVSLGVWAMVAVVVSGLIGRYLTTELPDLASQASLQVLDLDRQLAELRNRHAGVSVADKYYKEMQKVYAVVTDRGLSPIGASVLALRVLVRDEAARLFRPLLLRRQLSGIADRKARKQVAQVTTRLLLLERRRVLLPRVEVMFREWKTIHVPFSIVLTILAGIHITLELMR